MATKNYNGQTVEIIDATPTWSGVLNWYLEVIKNGNFEGVKTAKEELKRMAKAADQFNEMASEQSSISYILLNESNEQDQPAMNAKELIDYCNTVFEYERRDADAQEIATLPEAIKAFASINYKIQLQVN